MLRELLFALSCIAKELTFCLLFAIIAKQRFVFLYVCGCGILLPSPLIITCKQPNRYSLLKYHLFFFQFCLDHFTPEAHKCPEVSQCDKKVFSCPLCLETISMIPREPADLTWQRHYNSHCNPEKFQQRKNKPVCPVKDCREVRNILQGTVSVCVPRPL